MATSSAVFFRNIVRQYRLMRIRAPYLVKYAVLSLLLFICLYAVLWKQSARYSPSTVPEERHRARKEQEQQESHAQAAAPVPDEDRERKSDVRNLKDQKSEDRNVILPPIHVDVDNTKETKHEGPGEMGESVDIDRDKLGPAEQEAYDRGFEKNSFNQYASDMISVHRSLVDMRPKSCIEAARGYRKSLPDASVIICFHNEAWSTLLRSVHSVLNRSPAHLLKEVILVDDASEHEFLKDNLDQYFAKHPKVKILRSPDRIGLIKARLLGHKHATGKVLTFLDSHVEATKGWLEPLLDRIARGSSNVVWPVIDIISDKTFSYKNDPDAGSQVGGFDWGLQFNWHVIPERDAKKRKNRSSPVRSPTMAGGLFAIDKEYFEKLGTYDPDFDIWGGENLEISFKTWMCGGTLEMVPCSRVGHVFRDKSPYKWRAGQDVLKKNLVRLAEVWLDDYKQNYYDRINNELGDFGDISDRVELRKSLGCKSFQWYIDNVYPELFIPDQAQAYGEVRNSALAGAYCMDGDPDSTNKTVDIYPCHNLGGNQYWSYSNDSEIRRDDYCVDYASSRLLLVPCHGSKGNQEWKHDRKSGLIRNPTADLCMEIQHSKMTIKLASCDADKEEQKWTFKNYREDKKGKSIKKAKIKKKPPKEFLPAEERYDTR